MSIPDGASLITLTVERGGSVAFSPDGGILLGNVGQNVIHAWNLDDHALLYAGQEPGWTVSDFVISATSETLAYSCGEEVKLRTFADGAFLKLIDFAPMKPYGSEDREHVRSVVLNPDGNMMACCASGRENTLIWRASQAAFHPLDEVNITPTSPLKHRIAMSANKRIVARASSDNIHLWTVAFEAWRM